MLDVVEFDRWMSQADHNLASAERDERDGDYAWACFKAQQAAEIATKGLLLGLGQPAFGHSVLRLLQRIAALQIAVPQAIFESAKRLDRHYIPTRYPNAYPSASPFEFYNASDAEQALDDAEKVIAFVRHSFHDTQMASGAQAEAGRIERFSDAICPTDE